jgi:hypothetical protein
LQEPLMIQLEAGRQALLDRLTRERSTAPDFCQIIMSTNLASRVLSLDSRTTKEAFSLVL